MNGSLVGLVRIPPSPSPNHQTATDHTTDAPSAASTVRGQSIPRASRSWIVAKTVLYNTRWWSMTWAAHVTGWATTPGLPAAVGSMISVTKDLENMYGWYWRAASSSHTTPRPICRRRR